MSGCGTGVPPVGPAGRDLSPVFRCLIPAIPIPSPSFRGARRCGATRNLLLLFPGCPNRSDLAMREPQRGYFCFPPMVLFFCANGLEKQALLWRQPRNPSRARSDRKRRPHLPRSALQFQRHLQRAHQGKAREESAVQTEVFDEGAAKL